ncbi:hypothetical protein F5Y19DRAFT_481571 [Xylariaceae sp. FL1651]|nr:hypothetical protein F5Y19DRAFT_481571 [Xylariaceae sp. FL1651]
MIQKAVQWARRNSVPFVTKSGGHSAWSTIGEDGIVIDLSKYSGIEVDATSNKATLRGSVLAKEVAVTLPAEGFFTTLGTDNSIRAIPYFLSGGISITNSITGYGSDQILSARMISAAGDIVEVTEDGQPELLYAIRGAGQFFGLVFELTIKATPLAELGNDKGVIWSGIFAFPLDRVAEVAESMVNIIDDSTHGTAGLMLVHAPPPKRTPRPYLTFSQSSTKGGQYPFRTLMTVGAFKAKGKVKMPGIVGLERFNIKRFLGLVDLWKTPVDECPDAVDTSFNFEWDSQPPKAPGFESAMSLYDIRLWHAQSRKRLDELFDQSIALMRGPNPISQTRTGPTAWCLGGEGKLEKLMSLKKWDPTGVFTRKPLL